MRAALHAILVAVIAGPHGHGCAADAGPPRRPSAPTPPTSAAPAVSTTAQANATSPTGALQPAQPAAPASASETPPPAPAAASPTPATPPASALLGRERSEVEAQLGGAGREHEGWTRHGDVDVAYRGGRCVRVRRTAPAGLDCADAATWIGYASAGFPLRRAGGCVWPGISERHRLAAGVAGELDAATRRIEVWLRE